LAKRPTLEESPPREKPQPAEEYEAHRPADPVREAGAWKVAYADFVTALMALFIVLWMMNSSAAVQRSVSGYFKDPRGYTRKLGAGPANSGESLAARVSRIQKQIEEALRQMPEFQRLRESVRFSVTGEGLRIDLMETEQGLFFVSGSPTPTPAGEHVLSSLAAELGKMPNPVVIEGHTDSRPFRNAGASSGYSNWELATDRANAARRLLHAHGMPPSQVVEVRGFADQKPLVPGVFDDPRNRRISLVIRFGPQP
jgi:chemotaxis protein MotB